MKLKVLVRPEPVGAVELWLEVAENLLQTIVTACTNSDTRLVVVQRPLDL